MTRVAIPYRAVLKAYLASGYLAVFFAFWQFAYRVAHAPFPVGDHPVQPELGHRQAEYRPGAAHPGDIFGAVSSRLLSVRPFLLLPVAERSGPPHHARQHPARTLDPWDAVLDFHNGPRHPRSRRPVGHDLCGHSRQRGGGRAAHEDHDSNPRDRRGRHRSGLRLEALSAEISA